LLHRPEDGNVLPRQAATVAPTGSGIAMHQLQRTLIAAAACATVLMPLTMTEALAQQSCLGPDKLSIQYAQTRPGPGGTWNYIARIANSSMQSIRFDIRFTMANAQPNSDIYSTQTLNSRTFREYVLANGTSIVDGTRITENTRLTCR
jgi:hypothetical protein